MTKPKVKEVDGNKENESTVANTVAFNETKQTNPAKPKQKTMKPSQGKSDYSPQANESVQSAVVQEETPQFEKYKDEIEPYPYVQNTWESYPYNAYNPANTYNPSNTSNPSYPYNPSNQMSFKPVQIHEVYTAEEEEETLPRANAFQVEPYKANAPELRVCESEKNLPKPEQPSKKAADNSSNKEILTMIVNLNVVSGSRF